MRLGLFTLSAEIAVALRLRTSPAAGFGCRSRPRAPAHAWRDKRARSVAVWRGG